MIFFSSLYLLCEGSVFVPAVSPPCLLISSLFSMFRSQFPHYFFKRVLIQILCTIFQMKDGNVISVKITFECG